MTILIEIAKPGTFRDSKGRKHTFSAAQLAECAEGYDPSLHEAPLVLGHPTTNGPAYGWVQALRWNEGSQRLEAEVGQVPADLSETLKTHFKKRSTSFYLPTHRNNPTPGKLYVRHVGMLGAEPPAIKGLAELPANFSEEEGDQTALAEFGELDRSIARLFRGLRDWFIEKNGEEAADKVLPSWMIDSLQESAVSSPANFSEGEEPTTESTAEERPTDPTKTAVAPATETQSPEAEQTEPPPAVAPPTPDGPAAGGDSPPEPTEREKALEARERELAERERQQRERERKARQRELASFCEQLVSKGKPLPCKADQLVSFMLRLDGESEEVASFGEGDERSTLEFFQEEILGQLPQTVDFAERAPGGDELPSDDPDALDRGVKQLMADAEARGEFLSSAQAVAQLRAQD